MKSLLMVLVVFCGVAGSVSAFAEGDCTGTGTVVGYDSSGAPVCDSGIGSSSFVCDANGDNCM